MHPINISAVCLCEDHQPWMDAKVEGPPQILQHTLTNQLQVVCSCKGVALKGMPRCNHCHEAKPHHPGLAGSAVNRPTCVTSCRLLSTKYFFVSSAILTA